MRKILLMLFLSLSITVSADDDYPQGIEIPVTGLNLSNSEIREAAKATLQRFGWTFSDKSDTLITASVSGRTKMDVDFSSGQNVSFKYQEGYSEHKYFRRLRLLRKHMTITMSDCTTRGQTELDAATKVRRNLVYTLAKSNWVVVKTGDNKIVAKSTGNGRIETSVAADGSFKMKRWDEIEEEYTDPDRDRYIRKLLTTYDRQVVRCGQ